MGFHGPLSGHSQLRLQTASLLIHSADIVERHHHQGPKTQVLPLNSLSASHYMFGQPFDPLWILKLEEKANEE